MNIIKSYVVTNIPAGGGSGTVHVDGVTIEGDGSEANPLNVPDEVFDIAGSAAAAQISAQAYTDDEVGVRRFVLYKNNVSASLTGTVVETLMDSFFVPAGTIEANDIIAITVVMTKAGTAGNTVLRINFNTSASLVGDTTVATSQFAAASGLWSKHFREIIFKNSVASQVVINSGAAITSDIGSSTNAHTSLTTNFGVDQYITISFTPGNSADTTTLQSWYVEVIRN